MFFDGVLVHCHYLSTYHLYVYFTAHLFLLSYFGAPSYIPPFPHIDVAHGNDVPFKNRVIFFQVLLKLRFIKESCNINYIIHQNIQELMHYSMI